ncbi:MAG: DUF2066 domain-containing protein [Gammaproteobacteria bacterium]|nr:DUF2066 domain-containing protein [Gammaproteobacteria bacterium]
MLSPTVQAVEVPTLYTAEVPFDPAARNARARAYDLALSEVILRVSGSELGRDAAAIDQLFPDPASYVMQFRQGGRDTLWVSFDGAAIEQTLLAAGQTVWGADRPLTLVWLAVDWGQGRREIIAADDAEDEQSNSRSINRNKLLRERVLEIAKRRGLPVVFPLLDTVDLQSVEFSDIWGGFDERVIEASQRYAADSVLIGRIRPGSNRRENWSYFFSGDNRRWDGSPELVVGRVADLLAAEFSTGGDARLESVAIAVSGIVSVDLYGRLHSILNSVSLVEDFAISEVSGDRVSLRVDVRGGADRLRRALGFKGLLEQDSGPTFGGSEPTSTLEFFLSP